MGSRVPYNTRKPFKTQVVCQFYKYISSSRTAGHAIRCGAGLSDGTKVPFENADARLAFMQTHCFICDGGCAEYRPKNIPVVREETDVGKRMRISERIARILADERCNIQEGRLVLGMTTELMECSPIQAKHWPEQD